jgi:hypothetical protein
VRCATCRKAIDDRYRLNKANREAIHA